jgi:hypothetical protein
MIKLMRRFYFFTQNKQRHKKLHITQHTIKLKTLEKGIVLCIVHSIIFYYGLEQSIFFLNFHQNLFHCKLIILSYISMILFVEISFTLHALTHFKCQGMFKQ